MKWSNAVGSILAPAFSQCSINQTYYQWLFLVPVKGGRWHIIPPIGSIYHLYPLIVLAFWGVKNATFYGNQKQPLILILRFSLWFIDFSILPPPARPGTTGIYGEIEESTAQVMEHLGKDISEAFLEKSIMSVEKSIYPNRLYWQHTFAGAFASLSRPQF